MSALEDGPVPAVLAVVVRDGAVLLVRRRNAPNAGTWGFPGGRIEAGEPLAAAVLRELREETGVVGEFVRVLGATDSITREGGVLRHFVLVVGLCAWVAGVPVAADDAAEAGWFPVAGLAVGPVPLSAGVVELAELAAA